MPHPGAHLHSVEWAGAAGTAGSDAMWELLVGAREKFDRMHESTDHRFFVDNAEKTAVDIMFKMVVREHNAMEQEDRRVYDE